MAALIEFWGRGAVVLALGLLCVCVLRGDGFARLRQRVAMATLVAAAMMPLILVVVPSFEVAVPAWASVQEPAPASVEPASVQGLRTVPSPVVEAPAAHSERAAHVEGEAMLLPGPSAIGRAQNHVDAGSVVMAVWLLGVVLLAMRTARGLAGLRRLFRDADDASDLAMLLCASGSGALGVSRVVRVRVSGAVRVPMTWGWLRPVIVLPVSSRGWTDERMRSVLLHELAHVRRRDWASGVAASGCAAVHWFNPLAWLLLRVLTTDRERSADAEAVRAGVRASAYADDLLAVAKEARGGPGWVRLPLAKDVFRSPVPALSMARRSNLEGRVMSILNPGRVPTKFGRAMAMTAVSLMSVCGLAAAAVVPAQPDADAERQPVQTTSHSISHETLEGEGHSDRKDDAAKRERLIKAAPVRSNETVTALVAKLSAFDKPMRDIEHQIDLHENRLDPHEAELRELESIVQKEEMGVAEIEASREPMHNELEMLQDEIARVELERARVELDLRALKRDEKDGGDARESARRHEQISRTLQKLDTVRSEISERMQRLTGVHMRAIDTEIREHHGRIRDIHSGMRDIHAKMRSVHADMRDLHSKMRDIHTEMRPISREIAQAISADMRAEMDRVLEARGLAEIPGLREVLARSIHGFESRSTTWDKRYYSQVTMPESSISQVLGMLLAGVRTGEVEIDEDRLPEVYAAVGVWADRVTVMKYALE